MSTNKQEEVVVKSEGHKSRKGKKDAQLLIRIQASERDEFIALCDELDTSAARELRRFIRDFIKHHKAPGND